jgi:hypothetical protein
MDQPRESRSAAVLANFVEYCKAHPNQRFWQALRNWSGFRFIYGSNELENYAYRINCQNTCNFEGRND